MSMELICAACSLVMGRVHEGAQTGDLLCHNCRQAVKRAASGVERNPTLDNRMILNEFSEVMAQLKIIKLAVDQLSYDQYIPWYVLLWRRWRQ
jgi:hypothetical protein